MSNRVFAAAAVALASVAFAVIVWSAVFFAEATP
jgi:hypothetical protein